MPRDAIEVAEIGSVRAKGWRVTNAGEARIARALEACGVRPADVEQQFQFGPYRVDFAFVLRRIAIEADGWVHTTEKVRRRDRERDRQLKRWGWQTVRIDVDAPDEEIQGAISQIVMGVFPERGHRILPQVDQGRALRAHERYSPLDTLKQGARR